MLNTPPPHKTKLNTDIIDTQYRLVVPRGNGEGWGISEMGEHGQKAQNSSYKINHGDIMYSIVTVVINMVLELPTKMEA